MTSQINTCSKNFLHFSIFQRKDHSDCTSSPVLQVFFVGPHLYFLLFRVIHCCVWLHKFYGSQINLVRYGALISFYILKNCFFFVLQSKREKGSHLKLEHCLQRICRKKVIHRKLKMWNHVER